MSLKTISLTYFSRIDAVQKKIAGAKCLLDAGCGDGFLCKNIGDQVPKIFGVDINESEIKFARALYPKNTYQVGSLYQLPYADGSFDTVVCMEVLEHLKDDEKALSELIRVLQPGGRLILSVPSLDFPFSYDPINYFLKFFKIHVAFGTWGFGHVRLYSMATLEERLKPHNLKIIDKEYLCHFLAGVIDNSYLINLISPLIKSDPKNQTAAAHNPTRIQERLRREPPLFLTRIRDVLLRADKKIFGSSRSSVGIIIMAQKSPKENRSGS